MFLEHTEIPPVSKSHLEVFVKHNIAPQFYNFILNHCTDDFDEMCEDFSKAQSQFVTSLVERYDFDGYLMGK
jgi:hypothetical protein